MGGKKIKLLKRIHHGIVNIIFVLLIICAAATVFSMMQSKKNPEKIPSIFGFKTLTVLTGSMRPSIQPGDLLVAKEINPENIKVGDVITFKRSKDFIVTHRVIEKINKDDQVMLKTKGDANNVEDEQLVSVNTIEGRKVFKIPYGGYVMQFLRSRIGMALIIGFLIFFIGFDLVKTTLFKDDNKSNSKDSVEL